MSTPLKAPQDACWDNLCPINIKDPVQTIKKKKLECMKENQEQICACCKNTGAPDCLVLVPDHVRVNMCGEPVDPNKLHAVLCDPKTPSGKLEIAAAVIAGIIIVLIILLLVKGKRKKNRR